MCVIPSGCIPHDKNAKVHVNCIVSEEELINFMKSLDKFEKESRKTNLIISSEYDKNQIYSHNGVDK